MYRPKHQYEFPKHQDATEEGILCVGGHLSVDLLLAGYSFGIFPWPNEEWEQLPDGAGKIIPWFSPPMRGVVEYEKLHIPRSLKRFMRKEQEHFSFWPNIHFDSIVKRCAHIKRKGQNTTWITEEVISEYTKLHALGFAFSLAVCDHRLLQPHQVPSAESPPPLSSIVAGIYGVSLGHYFCGESMFGLTPNSSKLALIALMEILNRQKVHWIDTQMTTEVVRSLGGDEISREDFLKMHGEAIKNWKQKTSCAILAKEPTNLKDFVGVFEESKS